MKPRSAAIVIAIAALAYMSAVVQRSTMGVASIDAAQRFNTNAEQLSMLAVAQLAVYAGMQIPVGLLLDKYGPRITLAFGTAAMAIGQFVVAASTVLGTAIVGRILVGLGDAFIFISMIRLVNVWFKGKTASQLQQWLGNGGQIGQVISAIPFAYLLHVSGWLSAFITAGSASLLCTVLVWIFVHDSPGGDQSHNKKLKFGEALESLRLAIREPYTRMAFWSHFILQSTSTMLLLLWGVPFLVQGEGLAKPVALGVLSSFFVIGFTCGLFYGFVFAHRPQWRRGLVITLISAVLAVWLLLILWPGQAPVWVIIVMAVPVGAAGPSSMIAFDYTRQFAPPHRMGTTNGFVNVGGFLASFTMIFLVGLVLDLYYYSAGRAAGEELYSLDGFRLAMWVVPVMLVFGLIRYLVWERRTFFSN